MPPLIYEPSPVWTNGQPEVWIGASGGPNWGGADVYISSNGTQYAWIGKITGPIPQGTLTASLPLHADPDTADTLAVDMTMSGIALGTEVTSAEADAFETASAIQSGGTLEIVAYGTVTATGAYTSNLTYLRRGGYGTAPAAFSAGAQFTRLNPAVILNYPLPAQYVGVPLSFKFVSFNVFGQANQDISSVSAYSYTPSGVAFTIAPPTSVTLTAGRTTQADGTTVLAMTAGWTASAGPLVGSYEVEFSNNSGTSWATDVTVGASAVSAVLAPAVASTNYQARVRAISQSGLAISSWGTSSVVGSGTLLVAVPSDPTGLAATAVPGGFTLGWTASTDPSILSYQIWTASGTSQPFSSATLASVTSAPATAVTQLGLPASAVTVFLIATNAAGSSGHSATANVTPLPAGTSTANAIAGGAGIQVNGTAGGIGSTGTVTLAVSEIVNASTSVGTIAANNQAQLVSYTGAGNPVFTLNTTAYAADFFVDVIGVNSGQVVATTGTIHSSGASSGTLYLEAGQIARLFFDGTNYDALLGSPWTQGLGNLSYSHGGIGVVSIGSNTFTGSSNGALTTGGSNTNATQSGLVAGFDNSGSGIAAIVLGRGNVSTGGGAPIILGYGAGDDGNTGVLAFSSPGAQGASKDQTKEVILSRAIAGNGSVAATGTLTADGNASGAANILNLGTRAYHTIVDCVVQARDMTNHGLQSWTLNSGIIMYRETGNVALNATPTFVSNGTVGTVSWSGGPTLAADTTNQGYEITFPTGTTTAQVVVDCHLKVLQSRE
jgi:hypothetical protein